MNENEAAFVVKKNVICKGGRLKGMTTWQWLMSTDFPMGMNRKLRLLLKKGLQFIRNYSWKNFQFWQKAR